MVIRLRVLVVDDDPDIRTSLETALRLEGHIVESATDGDEALRRHPVFAPDLILLDVVMGGRSGLGFCRALRAIGDPTPILMLTARDSIDDRVIGLDAGADDYLTKPFALVELLARVRSLTRRIESPRQTAGEAVDGLTLDDSSRIANRAGRIIQLTVIETVILRTLLDNPNQTVSRAILADAAWGPAHTPRSNVLDVSVSTLRAKLETDGQPRIIHTVRGLGYRMGEQ